MSEATSPEPHLGIHLLFAGATAFITVAAMYAAVLLLGLGAVLSGVNVQEAVRNPTWLVIGAAVTQSAVALVALGAARFWRRYQGVSTREALRQCFPVGRPSAASFLGALLVVFGITPLALGIALQPAVFTVYGRLEGPLSARAGQVAAAVLDALGSGHER